MSQALRERERREERAVKVEVIMEGQAFMSKVVGVILQKAMAYPCQPKKLPPA